jgi:hypothetical protein
VTETRRVCTPDQKMTFGTVDKLPTYKPTGMPESAKRADAAPRTMSAEDAQRIKDAAWREYVDHLSNAWKQP